MKSRITATVALGTALFAFGCTDAERPDSPLAPGTPPSLSSVSGEQAAERAALNELTRAVALALQDQGLRQRIKNDMRASRHTVEHKLEFRSYLHGQSGGILLAKMAKETGKSREDLLALVNAVRPLEFYMPVPEHRENWRGDDNLLVASQLVDHTNPIGYTLQGTRVVLDVEQHPATPTLGIVPVETNFSRPLNSKIPNSRDQGGQTIGTYCTECVQEPIDEDGGGSGGGGGGGSLPKGLYMTASTIRDLGESWIRWNPEIEVFTATSGPIHCSGDHSPGYRYFDQNS
jgi:hypothetical protein